MRTVRRRIELTGLVQGVGFRPAIHRYATGCGLSGVVGNDGQGVFVEVEGPEPAVRRFVTGLPSVVPPLAVVDATIVHEVAARGTSGFRIVESLVGDDGRGVTTSVAPDIAPCDACLSELRDPLDRRHRYPFVNCTDCGPRYSIVRSLPYDRSRTTMADFPLCDACRREYDDPTDRRHHAQPTCCPDCGPRLTLRDEAFVPVVADDVVVAVVERLREGQIVAVKGLGGYHLAVDAGDERAVRRLRQRKHREEKPLALLVGDLAAARRVARFGRHEADQLRSPERPVVLLDRRGRDEGRSPVAPSVAPGNRSLGIMLPPTPLHVLLAETFGAPLVLTSANRSGEPLVRDESEAAERLAGIADAHCTHDRPIHVRVDDSVTRLVGDRQIVVRRARGHAPRPIHLAGGFPRHTLACGALLKSTVCVGRDDRAVLSQHLGDLDDHGSFVAFEEAVEHLCGLFDVRPEVVAHDLHPDLPSTTFARSLAGVEAVAVQHHHAHIASCLADNGFAEGPVLGVAFDGMGLGPDGSVWGGEILHADLEHFERLGHLVTVPQPGGDAAVREPWRMAAVHLARAVAPDVVAELDVRRRNDARWRAVLSVAESGVHAPRTSSAGRLLDAIAAVLGVRDTVSYEGQAAIELEQRADPTVEDAYPVVIEDGRPFGIDPAPMLRALVDDLCDGVPVPTIAARVHQAVVDLVVDACLRGAEQTGTRVVALSGGVFQNALLVERIDRALGARGFEVLTHRRVPPNDGGISLGQAAVVAARDRTAGH